MAVLLAESHAGPPPLKLLSPKVNHWFRIGADSWVGDIPPGDPVYPAAIWIEASPDLVHWSDIALLHGTNVDFTDPASSKVAQRFYRYRTNELTEGFSDWKNQMAVPMDNFSSPRDVISWVKFAIATNDPTRVYFADNYYYPLHYDFVTNRVPGFAGLSRAQVDQVSLFHSNRQIVLGTVIQPYIYVNGIGYNPAPDYGIQLVGQDAIPASEVVEIMKVVRAAVRADASPLVKYIPSFEQAAAAEASRAYFESNGIPLGSPTDWYRSDTVYSLGWGLGRLTFVAATNVPAAYANGTLRPSDILLTDGIPAELPYVSGIITLTPAVPNSHVAILARSYGIPFVYFSDSILRARALSLTNRDVVLELSTQYENIWDLTGAAIKLIALDLDLDPTLKDQMAGLKAPLALNLRRKAHYGAYSASTTNLVPADSRFFGGKAANMGLLRRILPTNSPAPAIAFSMDLWDDFMDQVITNGNTLRSEISNRLSQFTYPANVAIVQSNLAIVRTMITKQGQFTTNQQQAILAAVSVFATNQNIRFRSSSNVEDSDYFNGAGFYDSYSGCSGDDLDNDTAGPSRCDPSEPEERGVFRAIRKVYASFYNANAFLERLRFGIHETDVGMGLLAHYSTPDNLEMANGVATVQRQPFGSLQWQAQLVSQLGAVSITNPDGDAIPEQASADESTSSALANLYQSRSSSLVPLGGHVMNWEEDYQNLVKMLFDVSDAYQAFDPNRKVMLDFEYKKIQPGQLQIKQVREIPSNSSTQRIAPYLLNEPKVFVSAQRTYEDVFVAHRLKSRWTFQTRNLQFNAASLTAGLYLNATFEHIVDDHIETNSFATALQFTDDVVTYGPGSSAVSSVQRWHDGYSHGSADFRLSTTLSSGLVAAHQKPFVTLDDLSVVLSAATNTVGDPAYLEEVTLASAENNSAEPQLKEATYLDGDESSTNVFIRTKYKIGSNNVYSGNPPLINFIETRIEGLTSQPIVLHGFFSQTWAGYHRQGYEFFIFEPQLEEGIDPQIVQELKQKGIEIIYMERLYFQDTLSYSTSASRDKLQAD